MGGLPPPLRKFQFFAFSFLIYYLPFTVYRLLFIVALLRNMGNFKGVPVSG